MNYCAIEKIVQPPMRIDSCAMWD